MKGDSRHSSTTYIDPALPHSSSTWGAGMRQRWTSWSVAVACAMGIFLTTAESGRAGPVNCGPSTNWKHWDPDFQWFHYDHNGGEHPSPEPLFVFEKTYDNQTNFHASLQPGAGWTHII